MPVVIPLCSSSSGNSVFAGSKTSGVLIDAGCSFKRLRESLALCGLSLDAVKAVLITHEHSDHINGLYQLTKHTVIPVYGALGTLNYLRSRDLVFPGADLRELDELYAIPCDYSINAFETSHDAEESVGFTLEKDGCKIAYCTDTGIITSDMRKNMNGADFVFLESNYNPEMLKNNRKYPAYIKKRIASASGHLSNGDCAEFVTELAAGGATRFILGHLSRENNTPEMAFKTAQSALAARGAVINRDYTLEIAPVMTQGKVVAV